MLEGLEASEVYKSRIVQENDILRLDSQYFKKEYLKEDLNRKKYENKYLGQVAFITDGQHGYHEVDESSPIRHLTAKNAKGWFANDVDADRIAKWVDDNNKRSSLEKDDLILSTRGTVGLCAIVDSDILPSNIDQDVARIKFENTKILPTVALTYLNCKVGQDWLERNQTGMVQQGIALWRVREIPIPVFSDTLQNAIDSIIRNSKAIKNKSNQSYKSAETLLLETLELSNFEPSAEPVNVKGFKESFLTTGRLDAEYYQKKFDELDAKIKATNNWNTLENILTFNSRGKQPNYVENGYPVINSKHVRANKIVIDDLRQATKEDNTVLIAKGDVLINGTGVGTIGRAATYLHDEPVIPDNHVTILRTNKISPLYLSVFLNSLAGQYQVEKYFKGSSGQIELYPNDINKFLIWVAPDEIQTEIEQTISEAFVLEKQSECLLETAKRAVEIAIEQDEEAAIDYIQNTNS